jgi:hypothetical protein
MLVWERHGGRRYGLGFLRSGTPVIAIGIWFTVLFSYLY